MKNICWKNALTLAEEIRNGTLSPVEVVEAFLKRINALNPQLNAFTTVAEENARREAEEAEKKVKKGEKTGPLHGVPIAIKDNIPTKGIRTTYGSKLYENHTPNTDHVLVERLKHAGAILLGKTNLPPFALLPITENNLFGATRNPWDTSRTSGGSSGGSAVAVACAMSPIAVGNDWGGSIRIPSSFCGVYGFKPSLGRIPRHPSLPLFGATAVEGPITRTVADAALMMDVMAGPDSRDPLSLPSPNISYLEGLEEEAECRLAYSSDLGLSIMEPEIDELIRNSAFAFADSYGLEIEEVSLKLPNLGVSFLLMGAAELSAMLGNRLKEFRKDTRFLGGVEIPNVPASSYINILYAVREETWRQIRDVFERVDFLLTPTLPVTAFSIEEGTHPKKIAGNPVNFIDWLCFTLPFSLTGQPAASLPCGLSRGGLPVGLQIVGKRFDELGVLRISRMFEKRFPWEKLRPPKFP